MKTRYDDGKPYNLDDLLTEFDFRLKSVAELADTVEGNADGARHLANALARLMITLRDDWDAFEEAVVRLDVHRHPEDWTEDTRRRYGATTEVGG